MHYSILNIKLPNFLQQKVINKLKMGETKITFLLSNNQHIKVKAYHKKVQVLKLNRIHQCLKALQSMLAATHIIILMSNRKMAAR